MSRDEVTIAVVTDVHAADKPVGKRRGDFGLVLLERAVRRLERFVRPDVLVVCGDVLDAGGDSAAPELAARIRAILDIASARTVVLPGNHDGAPERFYQWFPRPPESWTVRGVRFLCFLDRERPDYNAERTPADMERLGQERRGHDGLLVSLQHVPVFPEATTDCPYRVENADRIVRICDGKPTLFISGHYHAGFDPIRAGTCTFCAVPALCESPFCFQVLRVTRAGRMEQQDHFLAVPPALRDVPDRHVHSQYAYCADDITISDAVAFADLLGAYGIVFAEHASHLYWDRERISHGVHMKPGNPARRRRAPRADAFFEEAARVHPVGAGGLEADVAADGRLVVRTVDRRRARLLLGAVHRLPGIAPDASIAKAAEMFMRLTEGALKSGVDVLAHPFRVFRRSGRPVPEKLFEPVVRLLRQHGAAAEINYHTNEPPETFVRMCLDAGVPLSLGTDAHALWETAEFYPHLELLRRCGAAEADLTKVLYNKRP